MRYWSIFAAATLAVLMLAMSSGAWAASKRVALVIGNSNYQAVSQLVNPRNDSTDVAAALQRLGFEVMLFHDLNYDNMRRNLREFSRRAQGSERALVYFAGHGIEVNGTNYLIPVDAQLRNDLDVQFEAIPLDSGMLAVEGAGELRMLLLDACRNNPFLNKIKKTSSTRSIGRGLARVEPAVGTLVSFAAKEGTTADDGEGRNSPYTAALLENLEEPGLELNFLFRKVRDKVYQTTRGRQQPFTYGSLPGKKIFLKKASEKSLVAATMVPQKPVPNALARNSKDSLLAAEMLYWDSVKDSSDAALLGSYLEEYPDGTFSTIARLMIARIKPENPAPPAQEVELKPVAQETGNARLAAIPPETAVTERSAIAEVQSKLFQLNFDPGPADGAIGTRTVSAISAFQADIGLVADGQLTLGLLAKIRNRQVPAQWGIIGFSPAEKHISVLSDFRSRQSAVDTLRTKCGSCSQTLTFAGNNCAAIALSGRGWGWAVRDDLQEARATALEICGRHGSGCVVKSDACAASD